MTSDILISPVYFILGGNQPGQGVVITRNQNDTADLWEMNSDPQHSWFVLQTNYDHWEKPPFYDDRSDPGNYCLNQIGENVHYFF